FDHYWVPEADRRQDQIYAEIKGHPAQTFLNPDRKWIYGLQNPGMPDRVYYYKYFDPVGHVMLDVNVYEIEPERFRRTRHMSAERARWEHGLKQWVFQNGWRSDMHGRNSTHTDNFKREARIFPELTETPDYFFKENKPSLQINFQELRAYIAELKQSGF